MLGSTQWGSFLHNDDKDLRSTCPPCPKQQSAGCVAGSRVWFKSSYCSFHCHSYRSLAGRNLYRNASKNILKTWPPLMRKLSGDSCSHQLQTWLLQFDGLRSRYSTETAICLGEQLRGLIGTNCFQHISLVLLITSKFNFTSHWRSHSPPFWQKNNLEDDFVTSATALHASMKQTCL